MRVGRAIPLSNTPKFPSLDGRKFASLVPTDGRPCLSETWGWESREGADTSILEEFGRGPREPENANPLYFRRIVNGQPAQCT